MTVEELRAELQSRGVPAFAYSIGADANESYCLTSERDGWHAYYSERGARNIEVVFPSEAAACEELRRRVMDDGAIRQWIEESGK